MSEQPFDVLTRRAVGDVSRRASLLTIGATGLATLLGGSLAAPAQVREARCVASVQLRSLPWTPINSTPSCVPSLPGHHDAACWLA